MSDATDGTCVFRARTRLAAPPEVMFAFHSDPRNLPVVMPPTLRLVSLKTDGPAEEGRLIELHCRDWLVIPMHWTCRWRTVQPPGLLVDEIIKGPFRIFVHEHRFDPDGARGCVMTDVVTYAFGRGWWGRLISRTAVRAYLGVLFAYRHWRTRAWAARPTPSTPP
jgi:ligand-binding SRPBCC domain-containing protein